MFEGVVDELHAMISVVAQLGHDALIDATPDEAADAPDDAAPTGLDDETRVEVLTLCEQLKSVAAATQARATAALAESRRRSDAARGRPPERQGKGLPGEIGLARQESPVRGAQHLGLGLVLVHEMPRTLAALTEGRITEWKATLAARESACLSLADRRALDRELWGHDDSDRLGDRRFADRARGIANRLDPAAAVARARKARGERTVTIRPAPDTMSYVTALLPVAEGVSMYAALTRAAASARAAGDSRTKGQVMADSLVDAVTNAISPTIDGGAPSPEPARSPVPVGVNLVITDRTLFGGGEEPARLEGYGTVPAELARDLVAAALRVEGSRAASWLRRLYTHPGTGQLLAMDARRRDFPDGLADLISIRDADTCRTPWCDAPVRHTDHVTPAAEGGETSAANGQGLCEACNYVKQSPGWRASPVPEPRHTVETTTPTGHTHRSTAPPLPGSGPPSGPAPDRRSRAEIAMHGHLFELIA